MERKVLTITLKEVPVPESSDTELRLIAKNGDSRYDIGIGFDDGYPQAAEDVQNTVLGLVARWIDWELELKVLDNQ